MAVKDPRPKNKRRKPWSKLSETYKKRLLAKVRGVYKAYGKKKPKGGRGKAAVRRLGRRYKESSRCNLLEKSSWTSLMVNLKRR